MVDFDQQKSNIVEQRSVFTELILNFSSERELVRDYKLELLEQAIEEKVEVEKNRVQAVRDANQDESVWKSEPEILQLEQCYVDALSVVAPEVDLKGLSALEYCTMCIYYDSQPYPNAWVDQIEEDEEEDF